MGTAWGKPEGDSESSGVDESWLEGTNVREPQRNSRHVETLKKTHIKKVRRRPKSRACSLDDSNRDEHDNVRARPRRQAPDRVAAASISTASQNRFDVEEDTSEQSDDDFLTIAQVENLFDYGLHETTAEEVEDGIKELEQKMMIQGVTLSDKFIDRCAFWDKKNYYTSGRSIDELRALLHNNPKRFKACSLQIESAHKAVCVLLRPEEKLTSIEISGRSKCGKYFSEDEVVVEILNNDHSTYEIPRFHKKLKQNQDFKAYGKIVGRLSSKRFRNIEHPVLLCELDDIDYHLMRPLDKTVPKMHVFNKNVKGKFQVETYHYNSKTKELNFSEVVDINPAKKQCYVFLVVYIRWDAVYPLGAVMKIMRTDGDTNNGLKILEIQYQVPTTHNKDTVQAVDEIMRRTTEEPSRTMLEGRENLTDSLPVFTIDPPDSKDLDDALSLRRLHNGVIEVGVHIADVANFVQKDDRIDVEARQRATTFYPGNGKHPHHMLPKPLSENLCSLIPHRSRLALSLFFQFSINGKSNTESPCIKKTVVKSRRQFTYAEVQDIILDRTKDETFSEDIKTLFSIARSIRSSRLGEAMHALPIDVDLSGKVDCDSLFESPEAHYLVEEFMILSNKTAAELVCKSYKDCALLRCQDAPPPEKVNKWLTDFPRIADIVLKLQNIKPNPQRQLKIDNAPKARYRVVIGLQAWLWTFLEEKIREGNFRDAWKLIGSDELHPEQALAWSEWIQFQEHAEYRCLGEIKNRQKGFHFSLGISPYTHFTSPIRRYADLVTHRLIHAALDKQSTPPYTRSDIVEICSQINDVSRRAKMYGKQCKILQHSTLLKRSPVVFNCFIDDVSDQSIVFHVPEMRLLPQRCREVTLNLLNVSSQPTIIKDKDDDRPFDILTLAWQKRLYSHRGYAPSVRGYSDIRIDPHQKATFQQYSRWTDILKALVIGNTESLKETVSVYSDFQEGDQLRSYVPACTSTVKDVSSEVRDGVITKHFCEFSMSFNHAQIMSLQIGAEPQKGVLAPYPELLELTDNVKFCLQHPQDPVKYLAGYATKAVQSTNYKSIDEYLKTWLPLLRMENTTLAARDDSVTLNDLPVKFNDNKGSFVLKKNFCEERNIVYRVQSLDFLLNEAEADETIDELKYVACLDYLCVKHSYVCDSKDCKGIPGAKRIWLTHGQVEEIKSTKGEIEVHFTLHASSPRLPQQLLTGSSTLACSVEILSKPESDRRTEAALLCLPKANVVVRAAAIGHQITPLDKSYFKLARQMETEVNVIGLAPNNPKQHEAIHTALCNRLTFIQGPPGTGKTYTGIKLLYLFTKLNRVWYQEGNPFRQVVFCGPSNKSIDLVA
ncbi:helicase with zinc finger domain 2-like, partial [Mizuhopecten yessoensis]|uniref:helicase with zinc finger domain 2-like n=1 Tax=Mizuhopecten yessoensis TaxID=6573 RepID=UPI000B45E2C0